ncbi:hypothetical protein QZH41_008618, partial [Actinostola sp. cb2023]
DQNLEDEMGETSSSNTQDKDEKSSESHFDAWVTALSSSIMYLFAPVSTSLSERYGCRKVVIAGGLLTGISLILSSFVR